MQQMKVWLTRLPKQEMHSTHTHMVHISYVTIYTQHCIATCAAAPRCMKSAHNKLSSMSVSQNTQHVCMLISCQKIEYLSEPHELTQDRDCSKQNDVQRHVFACNKFKIKIWIMLSIMNWSQMVGSRFVQNGSCPHLPVACDPDRH